MDWILSPKRLAAGTVMLMITACADQGSEVSSSSGGHGQVVFEGQGYKILDDGTVSKEAAVNLNLHKMTDVVCDPFGGSAPTQLKNGIKTDLYWLDAQCPRYNKVEDVISHAVHSSKKLFFTDLFTPTRIFDKGFATQSSETVKDDQGNTLIEYFALRFQSGLRLPPSMAEGDYELAVLSDDATIMRVKVGDDSSNLINNDDVHMTKMGCASRFVKLSKSKPLEFELLYSQGPRYHIANVLMWRPSTATDGPGKDSSCGKGRNELYFNPNKNSEPQKAYNDLLKRGWSPVPAEAFVIPDEDAYNPCHEGTPAAISGFKILELTLTDAIISWKTDLPSITQVRYRNMTTDEIRVTESDNRLRTSHTLWLTGLNPGTTYMVEVLATTEDNGRSVGGPFMVVTP